MDALRARYPFLTTAREAIEEADVDPPDVIERGSPVVDRAVARVAGAIEEGRVGPVNRSNRTELLSYPVARVIVSLVDEPGLTRRYAQAEADTARERFTADIEDDVELRSVERERITLDRLLREFDLEPVVEPQSAGPTSRDVNGFRMDLGHYLELADDLQADRWRLVNRAIADGSVPVSRTELYDLVCEAIRARVEEDLPLSVPDEIAETLASEVGDVRERLADPDLPTPDAFEPELFPPCVKALRKRVATGEGLLPHSRFALASFLATIGTGTDEIAADFGGDAEAVREHVAHLREGDRAEYLPPSCATMKAYGDCVDVDSLCETIAHPLEYYEKRLDGAEPDQLSRPESQ